MAAGEARGRRVWYAVAVYLCFATTIGAALGAVGSFESVPAHSHSPVATLDTELGGLQVAVALLMLVLGILCARRAYFGRSAAPAATAFAVLLALSTLTVFGVPAARGMPCCSAQEPGGTLTAPYQENYLGSSSDVEGCSWAGTTLGPQANVSNGYVGDGVQSDSYACGLSTITAWAGFFTQGFAPTTSGPYRIGALWNGSYSTGIQTDYPILSSSYAAVHAEFELSVLDWTTAKWLPKSYVNDTIYNNDQADGGSWNPPVTYVNVTLGGMATLTAGNVYTIFTYVTISCETAAAGFASAECANTWGGPGLGLTLTSATWEYQT